MTKPDSEMGTERIVSAAIHYKQVIASLPSPARHHSIINALACAGQETPILGEQGFLTSTGRFVNRREAMKIAQHHGQIRAGAKIEQDELYSEDLW